MSDPDRLDEIADDIDRRTRQISNALDDASSSRPMTPEQYVDLTYGHLSPTELRAEYERLCAENDIHLPTERTPVSADLFPFDDDDDSLETDEEVSATMESQPDSTSPAVPAGPAPGYMTADDYIRERNRHLPPSLRVKTLDLSMAPKKPERDPEDDYPLDVCPLDAVVPLDRGWIWPGYIPEGSITLIGSAPGAGRSSVTAALAAIISAGGSFPDGHTTEPQRILYIAPTYFGHMPFRARMDALGANTVNIRMLNTGNPGTLPLNFPKVKRYILDHLIDVVVIDDINTMLGIGARATDRRIRVACQPVEKLAEETGVAIIATLRTTALDLTHPRRRTILTASEWPAIARSVIALGPDPTSDSSVASDFVSVDRHPDPTGGAEVEHSAPATTPHPDATGGAEVVDSPPATNCHPASALAVIKSNLAHIPPAVRWTLNPQGIVEWHGTFDIPRDVPRAQPGRPPGEREEAKSFLQDLLKGGPVSLTNIMEQAKMLGIADITMRRAREDLGISSIQNEWRRWQWQLPSTDNPAFPDSTPEKSAVHN